MSEHTMIEQVICKKYIGLLQIKDSIISVSKNIVGIF